MSSITIQVYSEGLPSNIPDSDDIQPVGFSDMSYIERVNYDRRFKNFIPKKIVEEGRLSSTSDARDCFVYRHNSRKLQELLIDYSYNVMTAFNLTQET